MAGGPEAGSGRRRSPGTVWPTLVGMMVAAALLLPAAGAGAASISATTLSTVMPTCAVTTGGQVVCWGDNSTGQLGIGVAGADEVSRVPVLVKGLAGVDQLSSSTGGHVCARRSSGQVLCWGNNPDGQLGDGTLKRRTVPVPVKGLTDATTVSVGESSSCATTTAGTVACWGSNGQGQLGVTTGVRQRSTTPVPVPGVTGAVAVSSGVGHACAVLETGKLSCWGGNVDGQVGRPQSNDPLEPEEVAGLSDVTAVSAGSNYTCAVAGGQVYCWGNNGFYQLGDGTAGFPRSTPQAVPGLTGVAKVSAGFTETCATKGSGEVLCWGWNGSLLGRPSGGFVNVPTLLSGLDSPAAVSLYTGACTIAADSRLLCWGQAFGMGTPVIAQPTPVNTGPYQVPVRLAPKKLKIWAGKRKILKVAVRNAGTAAGALTVCVKGPRKVFTVPGCRKYGKLGAGKAKTLKVRVGVKRYPRTDYGFDLHITSRIKGDRVRMTDKTILVKYRF